MTIHSALDLPIPRNQTSLMLHLLRLVGREQYRFWIGGTTTLAKLPSLALKMEDRYPVLRSARQRSYDRQRGIAVAAHIVYPLGPAGGTPPEPTDVHFSVPAPAPDDVPAHERDVNGRRYTASTPAAWLLLTTEGRGGLLDPIVHDHHVMRDAHSAEGHLTFLDYVLMYATKRIPREIKDSRTGQTRRVLKDGSTWTWKMRSQVVVEVRSCVDDMCARLLYGSESLPGRRPWGIKGLLEMQRTRPLFSGVRNQVIDLHRYAAHAWQLRRPDWLAAHPQLAAAYGEQAGALRPVKQVMSHLLPTMTLQRIYAQPPVRIRDLLQMAGVSVVE